MQVHASGLVRFVLRRRHPETGVPEGLFSAAYALCDAPSTPKHERERLYQVLSWFETNLPIPARFNRSKSKGAYRRNTKGIAWIKADANSHIAMMRELASVLSDHGHTIDQLQTTRPGYIVYEDEFQVIAEPFADSR